MTLMESAVLRALACGPKTTAELWAALNMRTRQSHRVVALICERLRANGEIARHQTARTGVHRWEMVRPVEEAEPHAA